LERLLSEHGPEVKIHDFGPSNWDAQGTGTTINLVCIEQGVLQDQRIGNEITVVGVAISGFWEPVQIGSKPGKVRLSLLTETVHDPDFVDIDTEDVFESPAFAYCHTRWQHRFLYRILYQVTETFDRQSSIYGFAGKSTTDVELFISLNHKVTYRSDGDDHEDLSSGALYIMLNGTEEDPYGHYLTGTIRVFFIDQYFHFLSYQHDEVPPVSNALGSRYLKQSYIGVYREDIQNDPDGQFIVPLLLNGVEQGTFSEYLDLRIGDTFSMLNLDISFQFMTYPPSNQTTASVYRFRVFYFKEHVFDAAPNHNDLRVVFSADNNSMLAFREPHVKFPCDLLYDTGLRYLPQTGMYWYEGTDELRPFGRGDAFTISIPLRNIPAEFADSGADWDDFRYGQLVALFILKNDNQDPEENDLFYSYVATLTFTDDYFHYFGFNFNRELFV
jgi:hypothetical protein